MKREKLFVKRNFGEKVVKRKALEFESHLDKSLSLAPDCSVFTSQLETDNTNKKEMQSANTNNNGKHKHRPSSVDTEGNEMYLKREAIPKKAFKAGKHKVKYGPLLLPTAKKVGILSKGRTPSSSSSRRLSSSTDVVINIIKRLDYQYSKSDDIMYNETDYDELMRQTADHVALTASPGKSSMQRVSYRKAIQKAGYNMNELVSTDGAAPSLSPRREWPVLDSIDWTENALPDHHVWAPTNASGDLCHVGEEHCQKSGPRKRCSACHIVVHDNCLEHFEKIAFPCKTTFREFTSKTMRESLVVHHHWVHRRKLDGKCKQCGKSFEKKFTFRETKIIAISCSWCKQAYHNKVQCFQLQKINEPCSLGSLSKSIIPSTWIIKRSFRNRSKKRRSSSGPVKKRSTKEGKPRLFVVRPLSQQAAFVCPTLVFINPKSGGRQGSKLIQNFQWLMNPRQVFDLSKEGPQESLDLFRKVPNLRILACGGDGTVGWILSTLDKLEISKPPAVAILPLGTGNDLSRTLNFGHGYVDEPLHKIIQGVEEARVVKLDRWKLTVEKNEDAILGNDDEESSMSSYYNSTGANVDQLPLDVVNNYFSIGSDAQVALRFHESREAHPAKFTSRFGNKFFYVRASVLEYLSRQSKDLSKHMKVVCDGKDITQKIRDIKPVCLLFLNIPNFSSGTSPWGHPTGTEFNVQSHDDKLIEVLAFTINQLGMIFVGGHGERLCQCRSAYIRTTKAFPVQIDGEPCKLGPSNIRLDFFNQVNMLCKTKRRISLALDSQPSHEQIKIRVNVVLKEVFESYQGAKDPLSANATPLLVTVVMNQSTLESVRSCLHLIISEIQTPTSLITKKWFFLDASNPDRFHKIDKNRESHLIVGNVITSDREVYIMDASDESHTLKSVSHLTATTDKHSVLRNRIRSDSVLQSSSSHYSSESLQLNSVGGESNTNGSVNSPIPDPSSATLDVVFELPEVSNLEEDAANVVDASPGSKSPEPGEDEASLSMFQATDRITPSPTLLLLRPDSRLNSDSSSYSTSSNEYVLTENSSNSSPAKKSPLAIPAIDSSLPPVFTTQMSLEEEKNRKTKSRKRIQTDTSKSAGFHLSPTQLLTSMKHHNKNQSNNILGAVSGLISSNSFRVTKTKESKKADKVNGIFTRNKSFSNLSTEWNEIFLEASRRNDVERMKQALENGAHIDVRDDEGCTALHHVVRSGHEAAFDYLIKKGNTAFFNLRCTERQQTALHKAAWYNRVSMCKKLLQAGASFTITDYKGLNPVDKAKQTDSKEILDLFEKFRLHEPNVQDTGL